MSDDPLAEALREHVPARREAAVRAYVAALEAKVARVEDLLDGTIDGRPIDQGLLATALVDPEDTDT